MTQENDIVDELTDAGVNFSLELRLQAAAEISRLRATIAGQEKVIGAYCHLCTAYRLRTHVSHKWIDTIREYEAALSTPKQ